MDHKIFSTEQSKDMVLTTSRKLTDEVVSPNKIIPDYKSKDFARERTQTAQSISGNSNLIDNSTIFDFTN